MRTFPFLVFGSFLFSTPHRIRAFLAVAVLIIGGQRVSALDSGIDPYNLGKGDWIYVLSTATNKLGGHVNSVTNVASLMTYEASQGMQYIVIKAGTGSTNFPSDASPQVTTTVINKAHNAGLKIFAYTRSYGDDVAGEIALATNYLAKGCDGFVIDAEIEWESGHQGTQGPTKATQLCQGIKNAYPTRFLGHSPAMYISLHSSFPYKQFGFYCDAVMPQCYWVEFGITPSQCVADLESEWTSWQNGLSGTWTNSIKPIAPIANAWHTTMAASEITTFINDLKALTSPATHMGYKAISCWRADLHTSAMWTAMKNGNMYDTNAPVIASVGAGNISDTSVSIFWDTDLSCDSVVNYGLTTSYGTTISNGTQAVHHSVALTGLNPSTTYHYRVKSKNIAGQLTTSGDFTFTTLAAGQVNDIIIDNGSATVVGTWSTGTLSADKFGSDYRYKAQGTGSSYLQFIPNILTPGDYNVYEWHPQGSNRGTDTPHVIKYNGGTVTLLVNQQINGGQWNLLGTFNFAAGTAGNVKITDAVSGSSLLSMADAIKFSYAVAVSPPNPPSGLTATAVSQSQINLAWTDNSNDEDGFIVSRSLTSGGPYSDIVTLPANTVSFNNTGLLSGTTYYYVVRAVNSGGSSALSAQASATTFVGPPAAPSGLSAAAMSSSRIDLAWFDNSSNETSFTVARSTTSGGPYTDIATLGANLTTYSDTGLAAATTYYYVVRASNSGGSSANSSQATATTLSSPPAAPSGLTASAASSTSINLSWTDNSSNEANFIVGRSSTNGGPYTDIATLSANVTSYSDTGLSGGTTYYYVVRASNAGGSSANSAQASATTQPVADIIIDNPAATVTGSWSSGTTSTDKFGTNYRYKSAGTGSAFVTFTPNISVAGNYQVFCWYPQGSNRTTSAAHVINYNGGSTTVTVNQQVNGGQWNLLGIFNFAAGTTGNARVTDNFTGTGVVMADAIKFVYVP